MFDLAASTSKNLTNDPSNDEFPMWNGSTLYFLSDRGPENRANIWSYRDGQAKQVTKFADFDIHFPSIGPSEIVFEAGGTLYLMSLADETYKKVDVSVVTDKITLLPHSANAADLIDAISLAPDGKRALFGARGDVFSVPAEHGPVIDLTNTSGVAERYPAWSPDGKRVAYWSDASGEYELTLRDLDKPGAEQKLTSFGPGYRYRPFWSPDSKMLAFIDQAMKIRVYDVDKKKSMDVDRGLWMYEDELETFAPSWSPDSRWLAYRKDMENRNGAIALFDTKEGKTHQVTSGYYNDALPTFDPEGKYLFFATNRSFEPVYSDVDATFIYPNSTHLAVATLSADVMSPMSPRDDSTMVAAADKKDDKKKDDKKDKDKDKKKEAPKETKITLDGFESRVDMLPPKPGNFGRLFAVSGKLVYQRRPNTGSSDEESPVMFYDLTEREEKKIVGDADYYQVSANGEKILVGKDDTYYVVDVKEDQKLEKKMPSGDLAMTVDPRAEWKQIFNDTWRFERDYFYDPGMHGVDWPKHAHAVRQAPRRRGHALGRQLRDRRVDLRVELVAHVPRRRRHRAFEGRRSGLSRRRLGAGQRRLSHPAHRARCGVGHRGALAARHVGRQGQRGRLRPRRQRTAARRREGTVGRVRGPGQEARRADRQFEADDGRRALGARANARRRDAPSPPGVDRSQPQARRATRRAARSATSTCPAPASTDSRSSCASSPHSSTSRA